MLVLDGDKRIFQGKVAVMANAVVKDIPLGVKAAARGARAPDRIRLGRMGALAPWNTGSVVVFNGAGELIRVSKDGTPEILHRTNNYDLIDIASANIDGTDTLFAISSRQMVGSSTNVLLQYAAGRAQVWTHTTVGGFRGVAVHPTQRSVYLSTEPNSEIRAFDLNLKQFGYSMDIGEATDLGALAFDPQGRYLYVGDFTGKVFEVDVERRTSRKLIDEIGTPNALAVDASGTYLYVADGTKRCIWIVPRETPAKRRTFAERREFRKPIGLTVLESGEVWVADQLAQAVFILSPEGALIQTIR